MLIIVLVSLVWFFCYIASILIGYNVIQTQLVTPLAMEFPHKANKEFITVMFYLFLIVLWPLLLFHSINVKLHLIEDELEEA